jgi:hypothetical protein
LNKPINYVKKLNELEEQLVSPCLAFVQIWQLGVMVSIVLKEVLELFRQI